MWHCMSGGSNYYLTRGAGVPLACDTLPDSALILPAAGLHDLVAVHARRPALRQGRTSSRSRSICSDRTRWSVMPSTTGPALGPAAAGAAPRVAGLRRAGCVCRRRRRAGATTSPSWPTRPPLVAARRRRRRSARFSTRRTVLSRDDVLATVGAAKRPASRRTSARWRRTVEPSSRSPYRGGARSRRRLRAGRVNRRNSVCYGHLVDEADLQRSFNSRPRLAWARGRAGLRKFPGRLYSYRRQNDSATA